MPQSNIRVRARENPIRKTVDLNSGVGLRIARSNRFLLLCAMCCCGVWGCLDPASAAAQECPVERALDYRVAQIVAYQSAVNHQATPEELQAAVQAATNKAGALLPQSCLNEIEQSAVPNDQCMSLNRVALDAVNDDLDTARLQFSATGDLKAYSAAVREAYRRMLLSTPHACWFQAVADKPIPMIPPQQCAQLRAQYEACKSQAEAALRECASRPRNMGPCRDLGPVCTLPPC